MTLKRPDRPYFRLHSWISLWALAAVILIAEPLSAQFRLPPFTKFKTSNGITVILMEKHEVPIVSFNVIVKTGSTADPPAKEGLAAITAALLRKGTKTRSADQIAEGLDF